MHYATKQSSLPSLITPTLQHGCQYIDNVFAQSWKDMNMNQQIRSAGICKRSGIEICEAMFVLLLWKWVGVHSIAMFCRNCMESFIDSGKDILYDLLKREDINWRRYNLNSAQQVYSRHGLDQSSMQVLVLDDSIKQRRGRKMEGVSRHFDPVTSRFVMGQQVLTLGLASEEAFLPLDSQVFVSNSGAQQLNRPYKDARSVVAGRYREATTLSKLEMGHAMIKRALRLGFKAQYLAADSWFSTKCMMKCALDNGLTAVLRMKKSKLKYRITNEDGTQQCLDAKQLYDRFARGGFRRLEGLRWMTYSMQAQVNLSPTSDTKQWQPVKLLFTRGLKDQADATGGRKDWALFVSTDAEICEGKMLEVYALRWGIEVYFKEAKQHLGFLSEQTRSFASHTASIHLCAIRYLMLVDAKLCGTGERVAEVRTQIQEQLSQMSFGQKLWRFFRALVYGALQEMQDQLRCSAEQIMDAVDQRVHEFFEKSLQLDVATMRLEHQPDGLEAI